MVGPLDPSATLLVGQTGNVAQINSDGTVPHIIKPVTSYTYYSGSLTITAATAATDIWTIAGSATKTVRVLKIELTGTQTTAGQVTVILQKRLSANTGGTTTTYLGNPMDTNNPPCTVTLTQYSANPASLGASGGAIRTGQFFFPGAATATPGQYIQWQFGNTSDQAAVLRGTSQLIAVNLNAVTVAGGTFFVNAVWTEE